MKKIFGIALMFAVVAGGMSVKAQTPDNSQKEKTEQSDRSRKGDGKHGKEGKKNHKGGKDRKDHKGKKDGSRMEHRNGQRPDLFAGITLTPEQQSQLEALKAEGMAQARTEKGDKSKMSKEDRQARREAFSAKVKEILTPEQWAIYEKNVENMKAQHQRRSK